MTALALLALVAATHDTEVRYPLAAALVVGKDVVVADVPTKTVTRIEIGTIIPEEADLSPTRAEVAYNGREREGATASLFIYNLRNKSTTRIEVSGVRGDLRFPRYSADAQWLYIVGYKFAGPGSPANPGQVYRRNLKSGTTEEVTETSKEFCHFSPVEVSPGRVATVQNKCMMGADINVTNVNDGGTSRLGALSTATGELAVALDQKTLLYTSMTPGGLGMFVLREGSDKPERLASISVDSTRIQPRFVCPKDVLYYNRGRIWVLDSKTGASRELAAYPTTDGGTNESH